MNSPNGIYILLLVVILVSAPNCATSAANLSNDTDAQNSESADCQFIDILDLFERPNSFESRRVCFDARIAVAFEGMGLYPPDFNFFDGTTEEQESLPFGIEPGVNPFDTERRGIRTGDLVHVTGTVGIDHGCLPADWRTSDVMAFCIPNQPVWLSGSSVILIEHIPAREQCETVAIEDIYANPDRYAERMICTEAYTARQNFDYFLLPSGAELSEMTDYLMDLNPWHYRDHFPDVPGDRVSVAGAFVIIEGCFDGQALPVAAYENLQPVECPTVLSFELYDIENMTNLDPWDHCRNVAIEDLYADPMEYDSQLLCGEAIMLTELPDEGTYQHVLTANGTLPNAPFVGRIVTELHAADDLPATPFTGRSARVRFVGYFDAEDECFTVGREAMADGRITPDEFARTCLRSDGPSWIDLISSVYLD